ncbi:MAG TPA: sensor histidine kinase [Bacteroidales bacterium]|nr:sensor histidine kinase [Bacteroidales bacterium]
MDLVQNSIRAQATKIDISVHESQTTNRLDITIADNGVGMPYQILQKVTDPFYTSRTTRKVGLGIPLYKHLVDQCNGRLSIISVEGQGTTLTSYMELNHIDRQPMGDISGILVLLISANPRIRFIYTHETETGKYKVDTNEIKNILGNNDNYEPGILRSINDMIIENLKEIHLNC